MPGPNAGPMLVVTGKVVTPTGGYQVAFDRYMQIRKGYPGAGVRDARVAGPGDGPVAQAAGHARSSLGMAARQPVGSVVVRCGDKTLAGNHAESKPPIKLLQDRLAIEGLRMLNLVSLIIGVVALLCAVVAFLPLLGWPNWLIIIPLGGDRRRRRRGSSKSNSGRNLNLFVIVVGIVRLMLGGGIL